jgi:RimJ/RimL family protein N-acetyltransferase
MVDTVVSDAGLRSLVLDIEEGNAASIRLAERLGARRRDPARVKDDRQGVARTLVVYVVTL